MKQNEVETASGLLDKEVSRIEQKIATLLEGKKPESLYGPCNYVITSGGKRLRPLLVLLSAKACGAEFSEVYNAAVAVELFHNFTLVHDDIMDNADKRRGMPTLHVKYDLSTAILAGDNLIAVAYMNLLKDCKKNSVEVIRAFTEGIIEVCEGQSLDKEFETKESVTISEYKTMISKKTAALAEVCMRVGSLLAGGTDDEVCALAKFGYNLGMAFQIQDDLLDILGDEKEFGKSLGKDLVEAKRTYLFLKALEKAEGCDLDMLLNVIRRNGITKEEVKDYRNLYLRLGVVKDAEKEVADYTGLALSELGKARNSEGRDLLSALASSLISRSK